MMRRAQPWLGTLVEAGVTGAGNAATAIDAAFAAVARAERLMSRQRGDSDLGRLNTAAPHDAVPVDPDTARVLARARALHAQTRGAFDPGGLGAASCGFDLDETIAWRTDARARISLDGIAKGHAVDAAVEAMRAAGADAGWVNAGGDLRAFGNLSLPVRLRLGATGRDIIVSNSALASSEFGDARPPRATSTLRAHGGRRPCVLGAAVIAPECWIADALTKVVTVMGRRAAPWLEDWGATPVWQA